MNETPRQVVLHAAVESLQALAFETTSQDIRIAALQLTEDLWYQYLTNKALSEVHYAKRKRSTKKGKGQGALQSVPTLQPPHTDLRGAG